MRVGPELLALDQSHISRSLSRPLDFHTVEELA